MKKPKLYYTKIGNATPNDLAQLYYNGSHQSQMFYQPNGEHKDLDLLLPQDSSGTVTLNKNLNILPMLLGRKQEMQDSTFCNKCLFYCQDPRTMP